MTAFDDILGNDIWSQIGGAFKRPPQPADREGRIVCAGCHVGHPFVTDLRPWPPNSDGLRYCGACRMQRAIA